MARPTLGGVARSTARTIQPIEPRPAGGPPSSATSTATVSGGPAEQGDAGHGTDLWLPSGLVERVLADLARREDGRTVTALVVDLLVEWEQSA